MILYVNADNEIKDVDITSDTSLTALEVLDDGNPFEGWTVAKICCYKVTVSEGIVTMMTPYVDSKLIEHIEKLGSIDDIEGAGIEENGGAVLDIAQLADENSTAITDLAEYIAELEERISVLEDN